MYRVYEDRATDRLAIARLEVSPSRRVRNPGQTTPGYKHSVDVLARDFGDSPAEAIAKYIARLEAEIAGRNDDNARARQRIAEARRKEGAADRG